MFTGRGPGRHFGHPCSRAVDTGVIFDNRVQGAGSGHAVDTVNTARVHG